jgi:hypothetical protein
MRSMASGLLAISVLFQWTAASAADPTLTCNSGKLKVAGKYGACRLTAEAKAVKAGEPADFTRCGEAFSGKWQSAEEKAGSLVCPTEGDEVAIGARITAHSDAIATLLSGGELAECGNGIVDGDDQCEGVDLNGQSCSSLGFAGGTLACTAGCALDASNCEAPRFPASGETTSYGAGSDGDLEAGGTMSFVDNADGTITDTNTGLMWEKKVELTGFVIGVNCNDETGKCANPHNADNGYSWSSSGTSAFDGTIVTVFLEQLNNRCDQDTTVSCTVNADCAGPGGACGFAGHRDWRLPNVKELTSIVDFELGYPGPTVRPAFHGTSCGPACADITDPACSCDTGQPYWSSTSFHNSPTLAWSIFTGEGFSYYDGKGNPMSVRAVRGGL